MYVSSLLPLRPPRGPLADPRSPLTPARPAALLCAAAQAATHCERQVEVGGGRGCSCPPAAGNSGASPPCEAQIYCRSKTTPPQLPCVLRALRPLESGAVLSRGPWCGPSVHARQTVGTAVRRRYRTGGATARRHQHEMYSYDLGTAERAWCLQTSPFFFRSRSLELIDSFLMISFRLFQGSLHTVLEFRTARQCTS